MAINTKNFIKLSAVIVFGYFLTLFVFAPFSKYLLSPNNGGMIVILPPLIISFFIFLGFITQRISGFNNYVSGFYITMIASIFYVAAIYGVPFTMSLWDFWSSSLGNGINECKEIYALLCYYFVVKFFAICFLFFIGFKLALRNKKGNQ